PGDSVVALAPSGQLRLMHHTVMTSAAVSRLSEPLRNSLLFAATGLSPVQDASGVPGPSSAVAASRFESVRLATPHAAAARADLTIDSRFVDCRVLHDDAAVAAQSVDVLRRNERIYWAYASILSVLLLVSIPMAWRNTAQRSADFSSANVSAAVFF